jgi:hypothetical protein
VHDTTSGPDHGKTPEAGSLTHPEAHLMCAHLHDPEHIHHLWIAIVILVFNISMTIGVPILTIQLLVTIGLFGRDALHILQQS